MASAVAPAANTLRPTGSGTGVTEAYDGPTRSSSTITLLLKAALLVVPVWRMPHPPILVSVPAVFRMPP